MKILEELNIKTNNYKIYEEAFLHSSYCNENNLPNNYERLEFLGDKVLDLVISDYLYKKTNLPEGAMTKVRAKLVCENALSEYALALSFPDYIKVGKGEAASGGNHRKAILADCFEAFLGALYIDQGLTNVRKIVDQYIWPFYESGIDFLLTDYKSELQELVQTTKKSTYYEIIEETGPAHNRLFKVVVRVDGIILGTGTSSSKKEAEQLAAKDALEKQAKISKE